MTRSFDGMTWEPRTSMWWSADGQPVNPEELLALLLAERDKQIVSLWLGLDGPPMSYRETSEKLGITKARVSQGLTTMRSQLHRRLTAGQRALEAVKARVATVLPYEHPDSDCSRVGILLLAALEVEPNLRHLSAFTKLPQNVILDTSYYLRANNVWHGNGSTAPYTMDYPWLGHDDRIDLTIDAKLFLQDCGVGCGRLRREMVDGKQVYRRRVMGDYTDAGTADMSATDWATIVQPEVRERKRLERAERQHPPP